MRAPSSRMGLVSIEERPQRALSPLPPREDTGVYESGRESSPGTKSTDLGLLSLQNCKK